MCRNRKIEENKYFRRAKKYFETYSLTKCIKPGVETIIICDSGEITGYISRAAKQTRYKQNLQSNICQ